MVVVTGAFSYSGRYLAKLVVERGEKVRTLTGHPERAHSFGKSVEVFKLDFTDPHGLARAMEGARAFANTYWVRFPHQGMTFERAVENSAILFEAAKRAGVERIVHTSITNPFEDSPFEYFREKARLEAMAKANPDVCPGVTVRQESKATIARDLDAALAAAEAGP